LLEPNHAGGFRPLHEAVSHLQPAKKMGVALWLYPCNCSADVRRESAFEIQSSCLTSRRPSVTIAGEAVQTAGGGTEYVRSIVAFHRRVFVASLCSHSAFETVTATRCTRLERFGALEDVGGNKAVRINGSGRTGPVALRPALCALAFRDGAHLQIWGRK